MKSDKPTGAMNADSRAFEHNAQGQTLEGFTLGVRALVTESLAKLASFPKASVDPTLLMPGKMLRTRLAARLVAASPDMPDPVSLQRACAATELLHTASLCHDDVIDNGLLRRAKPALWTTAGASGAILIGDLLLCEAMEVLLPAGGGRFVRPFIEKVRESVEAESEQELVFRGKLLDRDTCLRLARGKTGPLFAFTAAISCWNDAALRPTLEEAGYRVGTAYQLADDLMDVRGTQGAAGKTLGTDLKRRKFTMPQMSGSDDRDTIECILALCRTSLELLDERGSLRRALAEFLTCDMQPVLRACAPELDLCEVSA